MVFSMIFLFKTIYRSIKYYGFNGLLREIFNKLILLLYKKKLLIIKNNNLSLSDFFKKNFIRCVNKNYLKSSSNFVLLITHELSYTGAPIALKYMTNSLIKLGYTPIIASPHEGPLEKEFKNKKCVLLISRLCYVPEFINKLFPYIEIVLINTLLGVNLISYFNKLPILNKKIIWWIHESKLSYNEDIINSLPLNLNNSIKIFAVGNMAANNLKELRPNYHIDTLFYYSPDFSSTQKNIIYLKKEHFRFAIIGAICETKAQNIVCDAIESLSPEIIQNSTFYFIGKNIQKNNEILNKIKLIKYKYKNHIFYIKNLNRKEIENFYQTIDCLICSSIYDSMPIVVTEAMLNSKYIICSENTGCAKIIEDNNCGIIYHNNDSKELSKSIEYVFNNKDNITYLKLNARKTYESFFSEKSFEYKLNNIIKKNL